jgi:Fe2+ or Zn2+ uptake regulation protein
MSNMATIDDPADAALRSALRAAGVRVTSQRLVLYRTLRELGRHVTADELLRATADRLPGLSVPTVYATLDLLGDLGLVRRIGGAGGATLYDAGTEPHEHLVCRSCGAVVDVPGSADVAALERAARRAGLAVEGAEVVLNGLCADCRPASG